MRGIWDRSFVMKTTIGILFGITSLFLLVSCTTSFFETGNYVQLDLKPEANMDFQDKEANDGKGGWFDDGIGDLRYFLVNAPGENRPEQMIFSGIPYRIIDPLKNHGRSVVVLFSDQKPLMKRRSAGPVSVHRKAKEIWLLHAAGWGKNGDKAAECILQYEDGRKHVFELIKGKNVGDWYCPPKVPEGNIAWRGCSLLGPECGVYSTRFLNPHPKKKIASISFRSGFSKTLYALIAVTLGTEETANYRHAEFVQKYQAVRPQCVLPSKGEINPLDFPEYTQNLSVRFPNAKAAEKAQLNISPLPFGKEWAFTLRWDDCSKNHPAMAELMHKHGLRGTFFLTKFWRAYAEKMRKLKDYGCTFGNHTVNHIPFQKQPFPRAFSQIWEQQIQLETELDTVSIGFVFPGGPRQLTPEEARNTGRFLNICGIYSTPEFTPGISENLMLDKRKYFPTFLFSSNDRDPDETMFQSQMEQKKFLSSGHPDIPRITFGVHTWMNPEGFRKLDRIFQKYAHDPKFWNANENEYASYRYSFYHADPVKIKTSGDRAFFTVKRYEPAFLGAETPLEITFTEQPSEVRLNGKLLSPDAAGRYLLPHDVGRRVPSKIELMKGDESVKFPGIRIKLSRNETSGNFELQIRNDSGETLERAVCTRILPPHWKNMSERIRIGNIPAGKTHSVVLHAGETEQRSGYDEKEYKLTVKLDFAGKKRSGRIYKILKFQAK